MIKLVKFLFSSQTKFRPLVLMIGAPGVGKGTYSRMLSREFKIKEFSTGEELRKISSSKDLNPQLQEIKEILRKGNLVNDTYMFSLVKNKLSSNEFENGVILDGYPRTLDQAIQFQSLFRIDLVINTILNNDILIKKLLGRRVCINCGKNYNICSIMENGYEMEPLLPLKDINKCDECDSNLIQREDDNEVVIRNRLDTYYNSNEKFIDFYKKQNLVVNFEPKRGVKDYPDLRKIFIENCLDRKQIKY